MLVTLFLSVNLTICYFFLFSEYIRSYVLMMKFFITLLIILICHQINCLFATLLPKRIRFNAMRNGSLMRISCLALLFNNLFVFWSPLPHQRESPAAWLAFQSRPELAWKKDLLKNVTSTASALWFMIFFNYYFFFIHIFFCSFRFCTRWSDMIRRVTCLV